MTDALTHYTTISDAFDARLRGVAADQWTTTVPSCSDWTVRDLVTHVIRTHRNMLRTLDRELEKPGDDADLVPYWETARDAVLAALHDDAVAARVVAGPFGEQPFNELAGGLLSSDTIFHTWDLAHATGQDETLDPDACEKVIAAMTPMDETLRGPRLFADKIEPPAGADAQTRMLCFGGRAV